MYPLVRAHDMDSLPRNPIGDTWIGLRSSCFSSTPIDPAHLSSHKGFPLLKHVRGIVNFRLCSTFAAAFFLPLSHRRRYEACIPFQCLADPPHEPPERMRSVLSCLPGGAFSSNFCPEGHPRHRSPRPRPPLRRPFPC